MSESPTEYYRIPKDESETERAVRIERIAASVTPRDEYEDDYEVYLIEDGERHWYVAASFSAALREHESLMERCEAHVVTITNLSAEKNVELWCESEQDTAAFRDHPDFAIKAPEITPENYEQNHYWKVTGMAAGWAHYYAGNGATQICSSCFP